jgi:hypothetical protein
VSPDSSPPLPPLPLAARRASAWLPALYSALWLGSAAMGLAILWKTENVPGAHLAVPASWPAPSTISRTPDMPSLVMFAHPKCPCTRASIGELANIMARNQGRVRAQVIFYRPHGLPDAWAHTDLWKAAAAIPGVLVKCDDEGAEAARFGATTSGFVVLYDQPGQIRFSGGITAERGHAGDSNGEDAINAILNGQTPLRETTPTLGCSLTDPKTGTTNGAVCTR